AGPSSPLIDVPFEGFASVSGVRWVPETEELLATAVPAGAADGSDLKGRLSGVHFQKIRMADEVYIVDPGGYVEESTRREITYAESLGKPVRYLSRERLAQTGGGPKE
ncbi:MAG TPA: hypothetical protein VLA89_00670, partial [Gemmatimonadales bacterium]|nr:hypothetical protein [Gemmatimonadales bacterium]